MYIRLITEVSMNFTGKTSCFHELKASEDINTVKKLK